MIAFKATKLIFLITIFSALPEDIEANIVGGSNANIANIPLQVSLRTLENAHFCGGSIISNRLIVTAGKLFFLFDPIFILFYFVANDTEFQLKIRLKTQFSFIKKLTVPLDALEIQLTLSSELQL